MATADMIPQDLPSFDDPKVRLVFEILCDDRLPPNPEHRWETWYAKRIVAALFPKIGPAQVIRLAPRRARTSKKATGGRTP